MYKPRFLDILSNLVLVILGNYHWILYYLTTAFRPRFLITLDEDLNNLPVTVRVGQAVDTVGQAGRPKTITGFQTHSTPVVIGYGERAELATWVATRGCFIWMGAMGVVYFFLGTWLVYPFSAGDPLSRLPIRSQR